MKMLPPPPTVHPLVTADGEKVSQVWATWFSIISRVNTWNDVSTFTNSWANAGGAYYNAGYHQDVFGVVRLRGRLASGVTANAAFTLPERFRPGATINFSVGGGTVSITTAGVVTPKGTTLDLDNISFIAEA